MGEIDKKSNLYQCIEKVKSFKSCLPDRVDPANICHKAKIPFNVLTYRESLLHRITELADSATEMFSKKDKAVSAIILTRAAQETFALLYVLHLNMSKVINSKQLDEFHDYLLTNTFGYRTEGDDNLPTMPNILGAIDKVDKTLGGHFRRSYESLSEYCHPNCAGVHSSYVKVDKENIWADIGSTHTRESVEPLIGNLLATLELFELYYNKISPIMPEFISICENDIKHKK